MPIPKKLIKMLDDLRVKYNVIEHKTVYTAYDLANSLKEDLSKIAKTLIVKADNEFVLIVLPASHKLDLQKLKKALKAKKIKIADEKVMKEHFKVKLGAITPFGKMHKNMPVYIDKALTKTKDIIAGAGSFEESLHMKVKDFLIATEAKAESFVKKANYKIQKKTGSPKKKKMPKKKATAKKKVVKKKPINKVVKKRAPAKKTARKK